MNEHDDMDEAIDLESFAKEGKSVPTGEKIRYRVRIDDKYYVIDNRYPTGRELLLIAGMIPPEGYHLDQKLHGGATKKIELDEKVDLAQPGIERFKTLPLARFGVDEANINNRAAIAGCSRERCVRETVLCTGSAYTRLRFQYQYQVTVPKTSPLPHVTSCRAEWICPSLANILFTRSGPALQLTAPSMARFPFALLKCSQVEGSLLRIKSIQPV